MSKVTPVLRVLFLCRGSLRDGLGHVIRSRTLALEMARRAAVQMIVIGDKYVDALLVGYGLNYQLFFEDTMLLSTLEESHARHTLNDLSGEIPTGFVLIECLLCHRDDPFIELLTGRMEPALYRIDRYLQELTDLLMRVAIDIEQGHGLAQGFRKRGHGLHNTLLEFPFGSDAIRSGVLVLRHDRFIQGNHLLPRLA